MMSFLARYRWRKVRRYLARKQPLIIGITGSSGKSLTQEAIQLILEEPGEIWFAPAQTLRSPAQAAVELAGVLESQAETILLPVDATRPGDIDWLAREVPIRMAVATNVGSKNLTEFENRNMLAHEYTSLVSALPDTGHAILNADDDLVTNMAYHTSAKVTLYGTSKNAAVRIVRSLRLPKGGFALEIAIRERHYQLSLPKLVVFPQVYAALAALSVAHVLGKNIERALPVLSELHPHPGKIALLSAGSGAQIIDGSAGATPETMLAALHSLRTFVITGIKQRRIAILGDMNDLAGETISAHKRIGRAVAESAHIFIAVGEHMRHAGAEALQRRPGPDVHHFNTAAEVGDWLQPYINKDDVILIMGGPDMHMETVVADLTQEL